MKKTINLCFILAANVVGGLTINASINSQNQNNLINKPILSETEKEIRKLQKKVDDIKKLKEKQKLGFQLELNQLEKIKLESDLLNDLKALKLKHASVN